MSCVLFIDDRGPTTPYIPSGKDENQPLLHTPHDVVVHVRQSFLTGKTLPLPYRKAQLQALLRLIEDHKQDFRNCFKQETRKSQFDSDIAEINYSINDVKDTIKCLNDWNKPEKLAHKFAAPTDRAWIRRDPLGVILIIGTWNYPLFVLIPALSGAIAAGNCVVIKPSEVAQHTSTLLAELIPQYLDPDCIRVVEGGPEETTELLKERFDHIFYTGSLPVAKIVHKAANQYLTPTTLELGGKSPVYIDNSANLDLATKRLLLSKCTNLGQACISPDYVLCTKQVEDIIIEKAKVIFKELYGDNLQKSDSLCRMINQRHFSRIIKLLESTHGRIVIGGGRDASDLWIEPTLVVDVKEDDALMQDELFGPILPFVRVNSSEEAIQFIRAREKPLSIYVLSSNREVQKAFELRTYGGNMCINDMLLQLFVDDLPFGGVGTSGMGVYHGKHSFDTLSHPKGILKRDFSLINELLMKVRYPPYDQSKIKMMRIMQDWHRWFDMSWIPHALCKVFQFAIIFVLGYMFKWCQDNFF